MKARYASVPAHYATSGRAKVAFIGEAPSDEEMEGGLPLIGPAGRVFDAILRTANIERSEIHVTNVFDTQLPFNEVGEWCMSLAEARAAKATDLPPIGKAGFLRPEHRHHLTRLQAELRDINPTVIVPMGGTALWAFTGYDNIGGARGNITLASRLLPMVKMVPTYHPAFVMRQWKFLPIVALDFQKAMTEADLGRDLIIPQRRLVLDPSIADIRKWVDKHIPSSPLVSVDIETGWGQITSIAFAASERDAITIPFVDLRKPNKSYWNSLDDELEAWEMVAEVLEGPQPKLGQNYGGYDAFWLLDKMGIRTMNFTEDTRLMHHILYPELPKSLEFMGSNHSKQGSWKRMRRGKEAKREG